jgi:hypothetical protein
MSSSSLQGASPPQSVHSQNVHQATKSPCGLIMVALGVIILIGSFVANGLLFSHLGYTSFAIGGSGLAVGGALIIHGLYSSCKSKPDQGSEKSKNTSGNTSVSTPQTPIDSKVTVTTANMTETNTAILLEDEL